MSWQSGAKKKTWYHTSPAPKYCDLVLLGLLTRSGLPKILFVNRELHVLENLAK